MKMIFFNGNILCPKHPEVTIFEASLEGFQDYARHGAE
jgi:hypothetical protein